MCNDCWYDEYVEGRIDYETYLEMTRENTNTGLQEEKGENK